MPVLAPRRDYWRSVILWSVLKAKPDSEYCPSEGERRQVGRRTLRLELRQKIAARAAKGETPYAIAKALGIGRHAAAEMEAGAILSLPGANGFDLEDLVEADGAERQAS